MKVLILFSFLCLSFARADVWEVKDSKLSFQKNDIHFQNRSSCAKSAHLPTKEIFVLVDNVNIAKSVYRLAKYKGIDTVETTNLGVQKFRYTVMTLMEMIAKGILSHKLPMLQNKEALSLCEKGECYSLYEEIEKNWNKFDKKKIKSFSECREVKKFSTLHANLKIGKPDRVLLEEMAKEQAHIEDYVSSCTDFSDMSSPETSLYEFSIKPEDNFNQYGFAFWHSLKNYLSWAMRYSHELKELSYPFDFLFQSADVEEMLLFLSSGCESISPLSCDDKELSLNELRKLTNDSKTFNWSESKVVSPSESKNDHDLFSKPIPLTEEDLLNLGDFEKSNEWLDNFRENFTRARGYNKIKVSSAISSLSLITKAVEVSQIVQKLKKENDKDELYYLCSEFALSMNKDLSFLRSDLLRLKEIKMFDSVLNDFESKNMSELSDYFENLSKLILPYCDELQKKKTWDEEFEPKKVGFSDWYKSLVYEVKSGLKTSNSINAPKSDLPFLKIEKGSVLCESGVHCARLILNSMMMLETSSHYYESLVANDLILDSEMSNPYHSEVSCGVYDPWAKKNKVVFDFFQDLVQTAAFGFIPTPIYLGASLEPKRVVSFETLIKEGEVYYSPKYDKKRLKMTLLGDLGPMIGVPCTLALSGEKLNPFEYYMFNGISFSGCKERSKNDIVVSGSEDQETIKKYRKICAACAINMQTIAASVSSINPFARAGFFLVKGIVRLVENLKDPNDLSRDWTISPQKVALSYRYNGGISKKCARKLLKNKSCLKNNYERELLESLTLKYEMTPIETNLSSFRKRGEIKILECDKNLQIKKYEITNLNECKLKERI